MPKCTVTVNIEMDFAEKPTEEEVEKAAIEYIKACEDKGEQYDDVNILVAWHDERPEV